MMNDESEYNNGNVPQVDVRRGCCAAAGGVSPVFTEDTRANLPHGEQSY